MKTTLNYRFDYITECNMCGSNTSSHKIMGKRLNQSQGKHPKQKTGITTTVMKCTDCGLIYSNPQPVPDDLQDHYGVTPEDYWDENYFKINENYFQGEIDRLQKLVDFKPGMKSLDVGAGLGKAMIALKNTGFDAYGFEPSVQFHERAISRMKIDPGKLQLGSMEEIEYEHNSFDFISFGVVLEHLYDPSAAILKAMNWLKPNGIIHVEVPSSDWLVNKLINLYYRLRFSDYVGNISPMHPPYHLHEFSLDSFLRHSERHNYDLTFHEYYVCHTFLPRILDPLIKPYMKRTNTGMQLCVWLRKT